MDMGISVIPKLEDLLIHTGNIVNWNRLKGTVTQSATIELSECVKSTVRSWLEAADHDKLQYTTQADCSNCQLMEPLKDEERNELKLTVKIFVSNGSPEAVVDAVAEVMRELNVTFIETVILSVPEDHRTLDFVSPLWSALEQQVTAEKVYSLGISDLSKDQLEKLYDCATVKPCINQVNLTTCCVIPPELTEFAKEHDIQLLTHNDPPIILSDTEFQQILGSLLTTLADSALWAPSWVARYSVVIKCRGVIKGKGYVMRAARDVRKLPYIPVPAPVSSMLPVD
jgi:glutamate--cysteine ligase regulatory subunit